MYKYLRKNHVMVECTDGKYIIDSDKFVELMERQKKAGKNIDIYPYFYDEAKYNKFILDELSAEEQCYVFPAICATTNAELVKNMMKNIDKMKEHDHNVFQYAYERAQKENTICGHQILIEYAKDFPELLI